jgi:biopolymer transport protein ExbD
MAMINFQINRRRPRIELVPMIDVVFFILFFFLMFSTLKTAQTGVPVDLPKTTHLGRPEQNTIVVTIAKDTRVYFGTEAVNLSELNRRINTELKKDEQTRVIIKPDASVPYRELIRVMDSLAAAGVQQPLLGVDRQQIPGGTPRP